MAMGTRSGHQEDLWIPSCALARPASHPFYQRLNELLAGHEFDRFVEEKCRRFYAARMGRPGLAPGIYFRLLLVGYFEGIDSERGIAWRVGDSLAFGRLSESRWTKALPIIPGSRELGDRWLGNSSPSLWMGGGIAGRCGFGEGQTDRH